MSSKKDQTETMKQIDELQQRIDKIFKRVNPDPVYTTEAMIADAISDNLRYLGDDRKFEMGEIFFSILEQIYARIVYQDEKNTFCNPQMPCPENGYRLPQTEMLMRDMMPLAWSLCMKWTPSELKNVYCVFFQSFTEDEAQVLYDTIVFLAGIFPEWKQEKGFADYLDFWDNLAHHRDVLIPEDDEAKSKLLSVLAKKKMESMLKQQKNG